MLKDLRAKPYVFQKLVDFMEHNKMLHGLEVFQAARESVLKAQGGDTIALNSRPFISPPFGPFLPAAKHAGQGVMSFFSKFPMWDDTDRAEKNNVYIRFPPFPPKPVARCSKTKIYQYSDKGPPYHLV